MSAPSVSRTGLPFSHDSATASISRLASITSATRLRTEARSAREALPQAGAAAWAASRASSTSAAVDLATSQNGLPTTGLMFAMYLPPTGSTNFPPMKFPYRELTETMLPWVPGAL